MTIVFFTDVDECSLPLQLCHSNATCTDIEDGFICTCKSGYFGNGTSCIGKLDILVRESIASLYRDHADTPICHNDYGLWANPLNAITFECIT